MRNVIAGLMLFLAAFASEAIAKTYADVEREAREAYEELDRETAELKAEERAEQQAEFRLHALSEITLLERDLKVMHGDTTATEIMSDARSLTYKMIASAANPAAKRVIFDHFIHEVRVKAMEVEVERVPEEQEPASGTTEGMTPPSVAPARFLQFTPEQVENARSRANWMENIKAATAPAKKRGWGRLLFWRKALPAWYGDVGQTWTSADGKVTFAVGSSSGRSEDLTRRGAELAAARLLLRDFYVETRPGVTVMLFSGASPIRGVAFAEGKKNVVYCLAASPTELLRQAAEAAE